MAKQFKTTIAPVALSSDPSDSAAGSIYYNTSINALKYYNGASWSVIGSVGQSASANSIQSLSLAPQNPIKGTVYFDTSENTIKVFNGIIWYDVAGPKELLDHQHYSNEGLVRTTIYGGYVESGDYIITMDGGNANTNYSLISNNDIIDGGAA